MSSDGAHGWVRGRVLGRGSTASVFLAARDTPAGAEKFAVKSADVSRSAALQREGRILSSLCSPHVISCFGSDVTAEPDDRVLYNLFVERRARLYMRGILSGLAYLHSANIAHCDVKGQNVLLGGDGAWVKLVDLGCARWVVVGGGEDEDGGWPINGTPLYMAPEVARGEGQGTERKAFSADVPDVPCNVSDGARDFLGRCLKRGL